MKAKEQGSPQGHYLYSDGISFYGQNLARNGEFGYRINRDQALMPQADKVKLFQAIKESLTGMTEEQQEAFSRCSRDPDVAVMLEFYSAMTKARAAEAQAKLDAAAAELARRAAAEAKRLAKEAAAQPPVEAQPEKPVAPAVEVSV